jgi:hypothetical protein
MGLQSFLKLVLISRGNLLEHGATAAGRINN